MSEDCILSEACKIPNANSFMTWKGTDSELVSIQILKLSKKIIFLSYYRAAEGGTMQYSKTLNKDKKYSLTAT